MAATNSVEDNVMGTDHEPTSDPGDFPHSYNKGYALSGKIMLSAIVILFFVVILMVCLHLYARWYLLRARRRQIRRNRQRRTHLVFHVDPAAGALSTRGLDASVLKSLPVFVYTSMTNPETTPKECAVCLSEFEENETGRLLPKCNHSFHTDCIDMWFKSHSTCPLCRSPVEPDPELQTRAEVVVTVGESERNEPGPSSGLCSECCEDDRTGRSRSPSSVASSSFGTRRKPLGVSIEVPRRNESFGRSEDETRASPSPAFRSPMSRMLSFKRILSWERRGAVSPSGNTVSCSSATEPDVERGKETTQWFDSEGGEWGGDTLV